MYKLQFSLAALLALALGCSSALAQSSFTTPGGSIVDGKLTMCLNGSSLAVPCGNASNPFAVSGTFSATLAGFLPTPSYAQLAASDAVNHSVAVPSGADDVISNLDTNLAYCNFGAASTTSTFPVPAGASFGFHNGGAFSTVQCQSPTSSLKITISGGAGLFSGGGGGGGGSGGSGPLGTQAISNSQAVNPATSSVWSTTATPDSVVATGNISVVDGAGGTTVCTASGSGQTPCTGTPTVGSTVGGQVFAAGNITINGTLSGGTATMQLITEFSYDNVYWYPRGMFLDGNPSPNWKGAFGAPFEGTAPGGGVGYYRIRAEIFTVTSGSPVVAITIKSGQHNDMAYIGNLPMVAPGTSALGAVAVQAVNGGIPFSVQGLNSTLASSALVKGTTAAMTGTTSTQVIAAVSSQHIYVTSIHCNNSGSTGTLVSIQDGSGGSTLDTLAAGPTLGGDNRNGGPYPLFWTTIGNALYAADVTTGASVICTASGYSNAN